MDEQNKELIEAIKKLTMQLELQNQQTIKSTVNINKNASYYISRYIQEIVEASFGLLVVMFIMKKEFSWPDFSKIACIVGIVTLILEEYNANAADNFKQGIYFTIGAVAFSG